MSRVTYLDELAGVLDDSVHEHILDIALKAAHAHARFKTVFQFPIAMVLEVWSPGVI